MIDGSAGGLSTGNCNGIPEFRIRSGPKLGKPKAANTLKRSFEVVVTTWQLTGVALQSRIRVLAIVVRIEARAYWLRGYVDVKSPGARVLAA